jgi:hypothetical protein
MVDLRDIHSLTDFQRNTRDHIRHLKETGRAAVLTVNGRAELVVQDSEAYQRFLDLVAHAEAIVGIQRGLKGIQEGTGEDVESAFESLRRDLGVSERP